MYKRKKKFYGVDNMHERPKIFNGLIECVLIIVANVQKKLIIWDIQQCLNTVHGFGVLVNSIWGTRALLI